MASQQVCYIPSAAWEYKADMAPVTAETLNEIAAKHNLLMKDGDAEDYLFLLNSLDATLDQVNRLPEYIDPRLLPDEATLPRTYSKPTENPLNAWSHQVCQHMFPSMRRGIDEDRRPSPNPTPRTPASQARKSPSRTTYP